MNKLILSLSLFAFMACGNQKQSTENTTTTPQTTQTEQEKTVDNPLLAEGNITFDDFYSGAQKGWFLPRYEQYKPDPALVQKFADAMKGHNYTINVYMGTWCHDSRRETPKLYKLLKDVNFDMSKLSVVTVNYSKKVPNVTPEVAEKLDVHHVPTIIFYENGKEVERFVESAQVSLLKDLITIASGKSYTDSYGG